MKKLFLPMLLIFVFLSANLSAGPVAKERVKESLPQTPAELLKFLTDTTWRLQSGSGAYYGEGTLLFKEDGIVEHMYKDGVLKKKHWGVTSDMNVIWGGEYLRVCRFSRDYKTFTGSRFVTTGRRMIRNEEGDEKITASR